MFHVYAIGAILSAGALLFMTDDVEEKPKRKRKRIKSRKD